MIRIKFFCRSFDLRLYRLSRSLYESMGFPCVRLTDQTADGYFYTMLNDTECDIAVNVDEDCFISDENALNTLIQTVIDNDIINAGCSDGVERFCIKRDGHVLVTNPFFNVFNLKKIREKSHSEGANCGKKIKSLVQNFDFTTLQNVELFANNWEWVENEPYGRFFLWLAAQGRTLFLEERKHQDKITSILFAPNKQEICRHTWFARFYSVPGFIVKHWEQAGTQKQRIDNVINEVYRMRNLPKPRFDLFDECQFLCNKMVRWAIKIPQRMANWPKKMRRRCFLET